jgi:hypothetical protein
MGMVLVGLSLGGCGGVAKYPVEGKVTYKDGAPVTAGTVIFESVEGGDARVTATGGIRPDGSYRLGANNAGDGVPVGRYRALVIPPSIVGEGGGGTDPLFEPRFSDAETAGLEFTVQAGKNEFPITVERAKRDRKRN